MKEMGAVIRDYRRNLFKVKTVLGINTVLCRSSIGWGTCVFPLNTGIGQ